MEILFFSGIIILVALIFDFLNGMNDAANSIATIVSTRVLSPRTAVAWAAFFNLIAAFGFGVGVAKTIGKGVVNPEIISLWFVLTVLIGAVSWTHICTIMGLPISVSHALIGGIIGAGLVKGGVNVLIIPGITKICIFIFLSPLIGMGLGIFFSITTAWIFKNWRPGDVDRFFRVGQLVSSAMFSLGHGANDAQKTMGIIVMVLVSAGWQSDFSVPVWVILSCHITIAMGTLIGGWKVVKTMGMRVTKLKPMDGFCAETAAAASIIGNSFAGIPVSTTHTITGGIIGVGTVHRLSAVRWGVAKNIIIAWILTIPGSAAVSGGVYLLLNLFGKV
ncbi:inorganic phosphate transporter [Desulfobacula toluolica]|uniref:Pit: predicted low-affinity inorganic phosphate transporter n=1 Tax=Desulfobacula toluolica (strain DSM 7467 / Tol2) TaxID=651182 RepID=K0NL69_DESTT|nr:inorganic phosphate transporter [Desulfobacula toluolica]CCK80718.1 Pit: predicted low-affinity inorganic phosphate transporter [Desulfobacula toluolica Tol2]